MMWLLCRSETSLCAWAKGGGVVASGAPPPQCPHRGSDTLDSSRCRGITAAPHTRIASGAGGTTSVAAAGADVGWCWCGG